MSVDVRYRGQGYELNLPFTSSVLKAFHAEHERRYGYSHPDREVELVTVRLRATVESPAPKLIKQPSRASREVTLERAKVLFEKRAVLTAIYDRTVEKVPGPCNRYRVQRDHRHTTGQAVLARPLRQSHHSDERWH